MKRNDIEYLIELMLELPEKNFRSISSQKKAEIS